jgi:hypothetical protein
MAAVRPRSSVPLLLTLVLLVFFGQVGARTGAPTPSALGELVGALTTSEMEGRRSGTPGGEKAAAQVADWLRAAGLKPGGDGGSFFQSFVITTGTRVAPASLLEIPGGPSPATGSDWTPHGGSVDGEVSAEVVFVGHGIIDPERGHDDYARVDARERIALALAGAPDSLGRRVTRVEKLAAARERGARALLIVDDTLPELGETVATAPLLSASVLPSVARALMPAGIDLSSAIGAFPTGRRARVRVALERADVRGLNVIGLLPGRDPALADETVVVGAHYDHLGRERGAVHPGADDNASGTAVVTALARAFAAAGGTPRTLVFALFGAEELGLVGSGHYVRHPARPLARTVAMLNFDMVGRLGDRALSVGGVGSATGLDELVTQSAAATSVKISSRPSPYGSSDHVRFYRAGVPVLFFHTGTHDDYHRPSDTADRIDAAGMARVAALGAALVERLAARPALTYVAVPPSGGRGRQGGTHGFLGVQGDAGGDGARVVSVVPGAAADRAGLRAGDVVIRLGGVPLASFEELRGALRERRAGERVDVVFVRDGERRSVTTTLDAVP